MSIYESKNPSLTEVMLSEEEKREKLNKLSDRDLLTVLLEKGKEIEYLEELDHNGLVKEALRA